MKAMKKKIDLLVPFFGLLFALSLLVAVGQHLPK